MKSRIKNGLFLLLLCTIIVMVFNGYVKREPFVPRKVKEIYRPIARNIRMNYEGFYDKSSTNISNLFRKFGIL